MSYRDRAVRRAEPSRPRSEVRSVRLPFASGLLATVIGAAVLVAPIASGPAQAVADDDWLGIVNTYRAMSGLAPVTANADVVGAGSGALVLHAPERHHPRRDPRQPRLHRRGRHRRQQRQRRRQQLGQRHRPRNHIDLWMTGPFHAIGILRHNLAHQLASGMCASSSTPALALGRNARRAARLDSTPAPTTPTVFPGSGATVPLALVRDRVTQPSDDVRLDAGRPACR